MFKEEKLLQVLDGIFRELHQINMELKELNKLLDYNLSNITGAIRGEK